VKYACLHQRDALNTSAAKCFAGRGRTACAVFATCLSRLLNPRLSMPWGEVNAMTGFTMKTGSRKIRSLTLDAITARGRSTFSRLFLLASILILLFLSSEARAQGTITVTGTVTDSDGQAWVNGSCNATYVVQSTGAITNTVTRQTITPTTVSCALDSSGSFSITLVSTANVYAPIPGVTFTVCPNLTNAHCYTTSPIVIGTTSPQDVSTQINLIIKAPRTTGVPLAQAYNDTEVEAVAGNQYFRVADSTFRCYTSAWGSCGTGGGGSLTVQTNGINNASQSILNFITSTGNVTGLTLTPTNTSLGNEKFEITGNLAMANLAGFPTAAAGDVAVYNGTAWARLAGNASGTNCFQENASGVPSWGSCGAGGGVTSLTGDGSLISNSSSTGAVTLTLATVGAHKWWGNNTGSTGAPGYFSIGTGDLPAIPLTGLAAQAANTGIANTTAGSTTPSAYTIPAGFQFYTTSTGYSAATATNLGTLLNLAQYSIPYSAGTSSALTSVVSPTVNGVYAMGWNVTGSAAIAPVSFQLTGAGISCVGSPLVCTISGGTGSGTVSAAAQYDIAYYTQPGTTAQVGGAAISGFQYDSTSGAPVAATATNLGALMNIATGDLVYSGGTGSAPVGSADFTISSHTLTGGASAILDLSAASVTAGLKIPAAAGAAPTADDFIAMNTTTHALVHGSNGTTIVGAAAATGTNTATTCTNQAVTAISAIAAPTCTTLTISYIASASINGTDTKLQSGTGSFSATSLAIGDANGGVTPLNGAAAGDVAYYNGTTWAKLTGNNSGTNCFQENASGVPSWGSCGAGGGVTSLSGTGIISNSSSTGAVTITWTGTSGGIPYFSSATALTSSAALALGHVLLGGGAGGAPTSDANLDDGQSAANTLTYAGSGGINASAGPLVSGNPAGGVGSQVFLTQEGTAPTGLATSGQDNCYADSTQHGWLCSFNAASTLPMVQGPASDTSGDLASFSGTNGGKIVDSSVVAANVVTASSTLTSNYVVLGAGTKTMQVVAGITTDGVSALNLGVAGTSVGKVVFANATSGSITLQAVTGALGAVTASLPANTGTIAELNLAQTWSALQTFGTNISIGGQTLSGGVQGTGDTKVLLAGTVSGTGATLCTDANGGATTSGCSGGGGDTITSPNSTLTVGGTSSATTLDLVGAAGKIMAGATPALTYTPTLGVDNSNAGTLTLANGSANAHTIWSSGATTTNTIAGFATAPTTGDLVSCTTASTTCTLTDSAVLAANVATASSNFTNGGLVYAAGANKTLTSSADFTISSHTLTGGASAILDLSAASVTAGLKIPSAAGAAPTADGFIAINTTNHTFVNGSNGTAMVGAVAATGTNTATTCSNQLVTAVSGIAVPTCTTATSAYVDSSVVTDAGNTTTTAAKTAVSTTTAGKINFIDFPERFYIPSANCNNTTAGAGWSIGSGGTVVCRAGTNNLGGAIQITDTSSTFAQFMVMIPEDWDTATNPYIRFYFSAVSDTTNGHTVIPQIKVSCPTAGGGTVSDDATFSAAQSSSTVTFGASAVANGFYNGSNVQIGSTQMTGCIAGGMMIVQVGRATDTATGNINFWGVDLTFPRLLTVQAN